MSNFVIQAEGQVCEKFAGDHLWQSGRSGPEKNEKSIDVGLIEVEHIC